jgi:hypothetical protein
MANSYIEGLLADKRARANTEWEDRHEDLRGAIANNRQKIWALKAPEKGEPDFDEKQQAYEAAHAKGMQDLTGSIQAYQDFLHPEKNPGMFDKVKHLIGLNEHPITQAAPARIGNASEPAVAASTTPSLDTERPTAFPASAPITVAGPKGKTATSNPQDVNVPAGGSAAPVSTPAMPAYKAATVAPAPAPGQSTPGTPKQLMERAKKLHEAQKRAELLATGAPLSPEQQAQMQTRGEIASKNASANWALDFGRKNKFSPEQMQELTEHIAGLPTAKVPKPIGVPFKDKNDGKWYQRTQNPIDGTFSQVEVPGYSQTARPSNSAYSIGLDSYAKSHGLASFQDIPEQYREAVTDYQIKKQAMDRAIPTSTTTTTLKLDAEGQFRPVTETNYRTPGGNIVLVDPMSFARLPQGQGTTGGATSPASPRAVASPSANPNPTELKKEASRRNPSSGGSGATPTAPRGGHTQVGAPLFAGQSKEYNDAKAAYDGAIHRKTLMHKNLEEGLKGNQQAMLSLVANHIGMTLGAQKGARINQAVWNEAVQSAPLVKAWMAKMYHQDNNGDYIFDGFKSGVNLTADQMKQMVQLADESTEVAAQDVDRIKKRLNDGTSSASGSGGPKGADGDEAKSTKTYKTTATGPNNHKIGTDDDPNSPTAKWFDLKTGKPI